MTITRSKRIPIEWLFWLAAVLLLVATDPNDPPLLDLCVWKYLGYGSCPGCGLGHALAYLLNGDLLSAIDAHPLSPFAAGVILLRIKTLWPRPKGPQPNEPIHESILVQKGRVPEHYDV